MLKQLDVPVNEFNDRLSWLSKNKYPESIFFLTDDKHNYHRLHDTKCESNFNGSILKKPALSTLFLLLNAETSKIISKSERFRLPHSLQYSLHLAT